MTASVAPMFFALAFLAAADAPPPVPDSPAAKVDSLSDELVRKQLTDLQSQVADLDKQTTDVEKKLKSIATEILGLQDALSGETTSTMVLDGLSATLRDEKLPLGRRRQALAGIVGMAQQSNQAATTLKKHRKTLLGPPPPSLQDFAAGLRVKEKSLAEQTGRLIETLEPRQRVVRDSLKQQKEILEAIAKRLNTLLTPTFETSAEQALAQQAVTVAAEISQLVLDGDPQDLRDASDRLKGKVEQGLGSIFGKEGPASKLHDAMMEATSNLEAWRKELGQLDVRSDDAVFDAFLSKVREGVEFQTLSDGIASYNTKAQAVSAAAATAATEFAKLVQAYDRTAHTEQLLAKANQLTDLTTKVSNLVDEHAPGNKHFSAELEESADNVFKVQQDERPLVIASGADLKKYVAQVSQNLDATGVLVRQAIDPDQPTIVAVVRAIDELRPLAERFGERPRQELLGAMKQSALRNVALHNIVSLGKQAKPQIEAVFSEPAQDEAVQRVALHALIGISDQSKLVAIVGDPSLSKSLRLPAAASLVTMATATQTEGDPAKVDALGKTLLSLRDALSKQPNVDQTLVTVVERALAVLYSAAASTTP